ncbi:MAG: hypothetical protein U5K54_18360 [Cytophagales bacterium]|nr:hypothetical protein [Cytophagales bacterium]
MPESLREIKTLRNLYLDYNSGRRLKTDFEILSKLPLLSVLNIKGEGDLHVAALHRLVS